MPRKGKKEVRAAQLNEIVRRLKRNKMPRADSKLGLLLADLEARLKAEVGEPTADKAIKVGLALQLAVLVAELPMLTPKGDDVNGAYKWAVDNLRSLLNELYPKSPGAKGKPGGPSLEEILAT